MFYQSFYVGNHLLRLVTNNRLILEGINQRLKPLGSPEAEKTIDFCFLSVVGGALPIIIPEGAQHIHSGYASEHFLYKQLWLIDFQGISRMMVDREQEAALGFVQSHYLGQMPWLLEALVHPVFEFLRRRGLYLTHAGAVSFEGKGLLIPGAAGSGKTTLVLHLVRKGFEFLSDDRCFLRRAGSGFEVLSFPEQVRVYPPNVADLPEFQFLQGDRHNDEPKKSFLIQEVYPGSIVDSAGLQAMVFPHWDPSGESRLEAISPSEAMIEMLPQTLEFFFPDTARAHFQFTGDLVEKMPCFKLYLGSAKGKWPHLVKELIQ